MNSYHIYDPEEYSTVLYHAIAADERQVRELAEEAGIILEGLEIELIRTNVRKEIGGVADPKIEDAQVY